MMPPRSTVPATRRRAEPRRARAAPGPEDAADSPEEIAAIDAEIAASVRHLRWFWLLLLKRGPVRNQPAATVAAIQAAHLRHLHGLRRRGQLVMYGPVIGAGALRGLGVFTVTTRAEAETLMADDPAVRAGRLRVEIRSFMAAPGDCLPA